MNLIFATSNQNKVDEIKTMLPERFTIQSLRDINFNQSLSEPYYTLEENARTKAEQVQEAVKLHIFSEDSGLFIPSLGGEPGVFSARYAGENATDEENIQKVLNRLEQQKDRSAYFQTVIHLILDKQHYSFSGKCWGAIHTQVAGNKGFGYDPIFIPNDYDKSFAELGPEIKNEISHRKKATDAFIDFLITRG